jgi:hypothetical protein
MLGRLRYLRRAIGALVFNEDITATYLTPALYDSVEDVEQLLKQMAEAQKLLEGEKYRTISLIPFFLHTIWRQYEQMSRDHTKPAAVVNRANVLQKDFENCYLTWSVSGRYVGMQSNLSSALDPRTKNLCLFIPDEEHEAAWDEVLKLMMQVTKSQPVMAMITMFLQLVLQLTRSQAAQQKARSNNLFEIFHEFIASNE